MNTEDRLANVFVVLIAILYLLMSFVTAVFAAIFVYRAFQCLLHPEGLTIAQLIEPLYFLGFAIITQHSQKEVLKFGELTKKDSI